MSKSIFVRNEHDGLLIELEGDLDKNLSSELENLLEKTKANNLLIDFANVPMVTPDGVRVLLNAFLSENNNIIRLKNPNDEIKQLLKTVGLQSLIQH